VRGPRPRGAGPGLASGAAMRAAQPGRPAQRATLMAARCAAAVLHGGAPPAHGSRPRKRGAAHWRGDNGVARRRTRASVASDCGGRDDGARSEASGGARGEVVGAADAARSGRHLSPHARVRTAPPTTANQSSAQRDAATDRRAPRVSRISNLNKSPRMKIA
jgi:hypothetical protein